MRVGIFGGTFNPPHNGHESSAMVAAQQLKLDELIIVPSGIPPHKVLPKSSPTSMERLKMTINAFSDIPNCIISDFEVLQPEVCYAVDTALYVKGLYDNAELYLLMGTDMFLSLETWKDFDILIRNIIPGVFSRDKDDDRLILEHAKHLDKTYGIKTHVIKNSIIEISSSKLRSMLSVREGVGYIKDTNYAYIIGKNLYDAKPDWKWLRTNAYALLNPLRIPHVVGCENAAVKLAKRWGVNEDDARTAAILHDCTKRMDVRAHRALLEENNVSLGKISYDEEKLLHAISGAVLARVRFGVNSQVEEAIRWHTTGKPDMTKLSKVLYLADYIEDTRDFPGVKELRKLAFENLDEAMILGLEMTVADVTSRGITPDSETLDAIKQLQDHA